MKKLLAAALALVLVSLCACAPSVPVSAPAAPAPTPAPVGVDKAFGGEVRIACYAADGAWFCEGAMAQAEALGITATQVEDPAEAAGYDYLLAYDPEGIADHTGLDVPVIFYTWEESDIPAGGYGIVYDKAAETQAALDTMFTYPSHEAPVRIVALFPAGDDAVAYTQMQSDGKLQDKGLWTSDAAQAEEWLTQTLSGITPGVLDTVFAGDGTLALTAYAVLQKAARGDAVEVCAAGLSKAQIEAMVADHFLMGTASGANAYGAGMLAVRMAAFALAGEPVETVTLPPFTVCSDEALALYKTGTTEANDILTTLDSDIAALYTADFIAELTEFYAG